MANITFDFSSPVRPMKPMHGVGQPPFLGTGDAHFHYLTEAGIPFSRLHDVGGFQGANRFVDIPNIFRDFSADENEPSSYDFTFTDVLLSGLVRHCVEPYFRLGVTIENDVEVKSYRLAPPSDFGKWARICEHIVAHYNEGWANGFHFGIRYWEIWNEPDGDPEVRKNMMWSGTDEDYFRLYDITAKHLKKCFPNIKVGGFASCGFYAMLHPEGEEVPKRELYFIRFFEGFFSYIKEHSSPIDFFSWHSYASVSGTEGMESYLQKCLTEFGYKGLENHLNEWNPYHESRGTALHSANVAAMMMSMQKRDVSVMCFYDARLGASFYGGMFNPMNRKPLCAYYSFVAFNELYKLQTETLSVSDTENLYVLSATDGKTKRALIVNISGKPQSLVFTGCDASSARVLSLDGEHMLSWKPNADTIRENELLFLEWYEA